MRPIRTIGALLTRPTGSNAVLRVVAQVGEQARRRQQRDVIDQDRGAVGRRARDAIVGDRAAAADHVLDNDGLTERARHLLADEARDRIGAAAGRIGDHQRHGLGVDCAWACGANAAASRPRPIRALL